MDGSRSAKLTFLRFQVRSLKQQERRLVLLHDKPYAGNQAEAEEELVRVRRHIQEAGIALVDFLRVRASSGR